MFQLLDRPGGAVSTAMLSRVLVPNDFGLVTVALFVIAVIELAAATGYEMALIRLGEPRRGRFSLATSTSPGALLPGRA
ncbi:MAG: oligosaccharide flippase family protein [Rubrivivax sp.]|nr:oligosaccharide flippase family protein [Rubrivivax sp.]